MQKADFGSCCGHVHEATRLDGRRDSGGGHITEVRHLQFHIAFVKAARGNFRPAFSAGAPDSTGTNAGGENQSDWFSSGESLKTG